jgi:SAM-dependent methyltransferase
MQLERIQDLDWGLLWQQARKKQNWTGKEAADWDKKAPSFAERAASSAYAEKFIALLSPQPEWTVLDVGCGPGTLALPLAARCRAVTALDFSAGMLAILERQATEQGLHNISARQLSWQDDWQQHDVATHDVVVASRSLIVPDLHQALEKLEHYARRMVIVADKVGHHGPFDPDAFTAIGRTLEFGPDYIYTFNLLYQMGRLPKVDYIHMEAEQLYSSWADALAACCWMFNGLSAEEEQKIEQYVRSIAEIKADGTVIVRRRNAPIWAYISWQPKRDC